MDEASALVRTLCFSRVRRVSWVCSMCQCFIMLVVHVHGRGMRLGTCLVLQPHASCVVSLQHVSMFQYAGYVEVWMRQAPWYVPCASAGCVGCYCDVCPFGLTCQQMAVSWASQLGCNWWMNNLCTFQCCPTGNFVIWFWWSVSPLLGPPGTVLHHKAGAQ